MRNVYCAIDLGATSGRVIIADKENILRDASNASFELIQRFPTRMYQQNGRWFWDLKQLVQSITDALNLLAQREDVHVESIGVDTWGVDVVYLDKEGQPLADARAYRDPYTMERMPEFWNKVPQARIYEKTGIQMMNFNTIYQFYACAQEQYAPFLQAQTYLFMPDYISYVLTGNKICEYTIASTSQLLNPRTHQLDEELVTATGARMECFPPLVNPGYRIGSVTHPDIHFNYEVPVIAVAGHDTASAVYTVPRLSAEGQHVAYLSCGTWSLMGVVTDQPIITEQTAELNFTNEGGVNGTTRLLKNITGLWIMEQCRAEWKKQGKEYNYTQLPQMATSIDEQDASVPRPELFNPDEPRFAAPQSMLAEVTKNQPWTDEQVVWCIYHSLANRCAEVLRMLATITPWPIGQLYIIGGGAGNTYLSAQIANYCQIPLIKGSTEATALGNLLLQAQTINVK